MDGFRGFFLLFMAQHHFNGVLGVRIGLINHEYFGWVDVAQGFVFLSGLMVGLVHGRRYQADPTGFAGPIRRRAATIYLYQLALILLLCAAAHLLGPRVPPVLAPYLASPALFPVVSALLVTGSVHMGILPMYVLFLLASPMAIRWLARGWDLPFAFAVLLLWMVGQTGLTEAAAGQIAMALDGGAIRLGLGFNALAWQALFFGGLYCGFRSAEGRLDLGVLGQEQGRVAFLIAVGAILALGLFDRIVGWDLLGRTYSAQFAAQADRAWMAWIYAASFAIDLYAMVWLLRIGPTDRNRLVRAAARACGRLFTAPPLVLLGQHSLPVFAAHVLLFYALATLVPPLGLGELGRSLILLAALAALWPAALIHRRFQTLTRPRPALSVAAE